MVIIITIPRADMLMVATPRAVIIMAILIMGSITGRVTRIMARDMGVILMVTMVQADAALEIYVVTSGVQIRFVNVWEGICAVAFKNEGGCMGRHAYGACSDTYCAKWCY